MTPPALSPWPRRAPEAVGSRNQIPPVAGPADLLAPGQMFSNIELRAMEIDGVLDRVFGSGYLPRGSKQHAEHRAIAMSLEIPANLVHRVILGRFSAAWVYGCGERPSRVTALIDHKRRAGALPPFSSLQVHEVTLGRFDVAQLAGIRITTVLRTAVDLAFQQAFAAPGWPDPVAILWLMTQKAELGCPLALVHQAIETLPRVPHKQRALARVKNLIQNGHPGQNVAN